MAKDRLLHWLLPKEAMQICLFSLGYKTCSREGLLEKWKSIINSQGLRYFVQVLRLYIGYVLLQLVSIVLLPPIQSIISYTAGPVSLGYASDTLSAAVINTSRRFVFPPFIDCKFALPLSPNFLYVRKDVVTGLYYCTHSVRKRSSDICHQHVTNIAMSYITYPTDLLLSCASHI